VEALTRETKFQIYRLINKDSVIGCPFLGISIDTNRVIEISEDHISIDTIHEHDKGSFEADYVCSSTEEYFYFDLAFLDDLVESYIGQREYSLTAYFNDKKEIVLAYRTESDHYKEKNLTAGFPSDKTTKEIVSVIHNLLKSIKL